MPAGPAAVARRTRLLSGDDIERVIAIDRAHTGRTRRHFFEKRFAAAKVRPEEFIQLGVDRGGVLRGFAIARILRGEFGHERAVAVLDALGVEPQSEERGVGRALMEELIALADGMEVGFLQSQADWTNTYLLRFFAASGFALAPRLALERPVAAPLDEAIEDL